MFSETCEQRYTAVARDCLGLRTVGKVAVSPSCQRGTGSDRWCPNPKMRGFHNKVIRCLLCLIYSVGLFKGSTRLRQCFKCHWISESLFSTSFQRQCLHLACCHSLCNLRSPYAFNILYLYNIKYMPACIFWSFVFYLRGDLQKEVMDVRVARVKEKCAHWTRAPKFSLKATFWMAHDNVPSSGGRNGERNIAGLQQRVKVFHIFRGSLHISCQSLFPQLGAWSRSSSELPNWQTYVTGQ